MNEYTLKQNVLHVNNVWMPSIGPLTLKTCKNSQWRKILCMWAVWKSF
jgi:hypothetical protein